MVYAGVMREPVTTVANLDISGHSVESRRMESNDGDSVVESSKSSNVLHEKSIKINDEEKLFVDEAERKLDKLEGFIDRDEEDVCLISEEDGELEAIAIHIIVTFQLVQLPLCLINNQFLFIIYFIRFLI